LGIGAYYLRGFLPIDQHRPKLERWLVATLEHNANIEHIGFVWVDGRPALKATGVRLVSQADHKTVLLSIDSLIFFPSWLAAIRSVGSQDAFQGGHIVFNHVTIPGLHHTFASVDVGVNLKERVVVFSGLKGVSLPFFQQPKLSVYFVDGIYDHALMQVQGEVSTAQLADMLALPPESFETYFMKGKMHYNAEMNLSSHGEGKSVLRWVSDLKGVEVHLPGSLAKAADTPRQLTVEIPFLSKGILPIKFTYRQSMHGRFTLDHWMPSLGLFDLKSVVFKGAKIRLDHLLFHRQRLDGLKVDVVKQRNALLIALDHPKVLGQVHLPIHSKAVKTPSVITVKLARLLWDYKEASKKDKPVKKTVDQKADLSKIPSAHLEPKQLPNIDFNVDKLYYRQSVLHQFNVSLRPVHNGVHIKNFSIQLPSVKLSAHGDWLELKGHAWTRLIGDMKSNNFGLAVERWDLHHHIKGGAANLNFSLQWPGFFYHPNWQLASGRVFFKAYDGLISHIPKNTKDKLDLLHLINLLSPFSLVKTFGFDLGGHHHGPAGPAYMHYDLMQAHFLLHHAHIDTQDFYLLSHLFNMKARGRIDLKNKTTDLRVWIKPLVSSEELPVLATFIGGPLVGAIGLLADKLLIEPLMGESLAKQFRVVGPWKKLRIIKNR